MTRPCESMPPRRVAKGDADERAVLQRTIEADRCYVLDRGSISERLWNAINVVGSSSVCRTSDRSLATVTHVNDLTDADRAANVISDEIVDRAAHRHAGIDAAPLRHELSEGLPMPSSGLWKQAQPGWRSAADMQ